MKNNFLFIVSLVFLVFSLYSVNALTSGTLYASVGENITVGVGDSPSVIVTDNTTEETSEDTGGTTSSGGSSGGSSGDGAGSIRTISSSSEGFCSENWQCSEWSSCEDGTQTRTCTDLNDCGTTSNKPAIEQECETTTSRNFLTGFAVGFSDFAQSPAGVATFIVVGLIIVGGITFLAVKGKFKNFLPKKKEENISEQ